jgi:hypothetical protein
MRRTIMSLAVLVALTTVTPAPTQAQTSKPKGSPKHRKLLYATLGALGGTGLGALWIVKLCPTGSDSPSACIAPPLAFVVGGAWAGYKLGQKASQPTPLSARPRAEPSGGAASPWGFRPPCLIGSAQMRASLAGLTLGHPCDPRPSEPR